MGLFGGGNSSSSTRTTTQSTGFSQVSGPALAMQGTGNTVSFIDPGALTAAQNIAGEALNANQLATNNASSIVSQAMQSVQAASQSQTQSLMSEGMKWGAIVALAYIAMRVFK